MQDVQEHMLHVQCLEMMQRLVWSPHLVACSNTTCQNAVLQQKQVLLSGARDTLRQQCWQLEQRLRSIRARWTASRISQGGRHVLVRFCPHLGGQPAQHHHILSKQR